MQVISGNNFSGRSDFLKQKVGWESVSDGSRPYNKIFISSETTSNLSGLTPTAKAEIELFARTQDSLSKSLNTFKELGLARCLDQNPFTLSGGEQVVLAIVAALGSEPKTIAIDCAFEQLSGSMRTKVISLLDTHEAEVIVCDNRDSEWYSDERLVMTPSSNAPQISPETLGRSVEPISIRIEDLCFKYKNGRKIFNNLNLNFPPGVCYRLKGENGVGKSTLAKILSGLLKPQSGKIYFNDRPVQPWKAPGQIIAYHFQNPDYQLFSNSVKSQLMREYGQNIVSRNFGIEQFLDSHPLDLPFVLRKRVALASTVARRMGFYIFDEPTLGQDERNACRIVAKIQAQAGIVISHSKLFDDLPTITLNNKS